MWFCVFLIERLDCQYNIYCEVVWGAMRVNSCTRPYVWCVCVARTTPQPSPTYLCIYEIKT